MRMMTYFATLVIGATCIQHSTMAQEFTGYSRDDYGKVSLTSRQVGAGPASTGNYKNEPISNYGAQSLFYELGRPIGRLDILTDAGTFPCTAFLISEQFVLTNYHCIPGVVDLTPATRIDKASLLLNYTKAGVAQDTSRFDVSVKPIEADKSLDYSILKIDGKPGDTYGAIKLSVVDPKDNEPYWIIGHPLGEAQHISRESYESAAPAVSEERLRHECDTLPGNSGSPVLDTVSHRAVALHHAGSSLDGINFAVPFSLIVPHSQILQEKFNS